MIQKLGSLILKIDGALKLNQEKSCTHNAWDVNLNHKLWEQLCWAAIDLEANEPTIRQKKKKTSITRSGDGINVSSNILKK